MLTLMMLMMSLIVSAQTPRSEEDPRNIAPTVGTGGSVGGPTGLFTVYDGQTLRRGEYTFSIAYSNFDRDPGNVDITEVPISFQIGLNDYIELFFNTEAWRGIKVNSPRNLSGFYLPNSQFRLQNQNGTFAFQSAPAIVLAPGTGVGGIFRPQGSQPFVGFPFTGQSVGGFGVVRPGVGIFGFPLGANPTAGTPRQGGAADLFPGVGSPVGGILPGIVLQTSLLTGQAAFGIPGNATLTAPTVFTVAPSYLPDAPFINRTWGQTAFDTLTFGGKFRFTGPNNPVGIGIIPFYRWHLDTPERGGGFNMLQRGAGAGSSRGDIGVIAFADGRLARWANLSGNIGYTHNGSVKSGDATLLDRGDELMGAVAVDFPVNRYFQLIGEARATKYVGGRTPNAFEQDPIDVLGGVRIFPARWFGFSMWYRWNANQQDRDIFDDFTMTNTVVIPGPTADITTNVTGVPPGFLTSTDPHGFGFQFFAGRRNERGQRILNQYPTINSVTISDTEVRLPCPPGTSSASGACNDSTSVSVTTNATDPENDPLVYQYTVSGGTIQGTGANVTWDVSGLRPGTYTLSVAVDDGCGVCGQPRQETIRIVECPDCVAPPPTPTPCPLTNVDVTASPNVVNVGETVTFTATADAGGQSVTYDWSVSGGEIVSGQGTPTITVRATTAGTNITATATVTTPDPNCRASDSATAEVARIPEAREIDRYGRLIPNAEKARLDNVAVAAQNEPGSRILIVTTGRNAAAARRRAQFARNYLVNTRGIDPGRIDIRSGGTGADETVIWLVPAGAADPAPAATPFE
ncbi:MAG: PKD domain-containing protein [Acidobacteriota bacterium]|nr:PKD domain-containing protein [Acidobacteriota bacterium]